MKMFSGSARSAGCKLAQTGISCLALVVGAAMFAAGCGKKSEKPLSSAAPPLQTTQDTSQPAAPGSAVNSQPVPVALATNAPGVTNAAPDFAELRRALARWLVRNRRPPANFEDFAATAGVVIPPPPAGKKYVITKDMHIQLVDR
jgi:hypothetical protein